MGADHAVGDAVEVRRNRNALGNFSPATVVAVKELPRGGKTLHQTAVQSDGGAAQMGKELFLHLFDCCTGGKSQPQSLFLYTVKFEKDGAEEKEVTHECIRSPSRA